jgi:hypothetical protein
MVLDLDALAAPPKPVMVLDLDALAAPPKPVAEQQPKLAVTGEIKAPATGEPDVLNLDALASKYIAEPLGYLGKLAIAGTVGGPVELAGLAQHAVKQGMNVLAGRSAEPMPEKVPYGVEDIKRMLDVPQPETTGQRLTQEFVQAAPSFYMGGGKAAQEGYSTLSKIVRAGLETAGTVGAGEAAQQATDVPMAGMAAQVAAATLLHKSLTGGRVPETTRTLPGGVQVSVGAVPAKSAIPSPAVEERPRISLGESGSAVVPGVLTAPALALRETATKIGRAIHPTGFATDEQLNRLVTSKGEHIEANRFQYNQLSKGNEGFFDSMIGQQGIGAAENYLQRLSTGQSQAKPELQRLAEFHRKTLDAAALGASRFKEVPYLEDYVPGLFTKPEDAERWFQTSGRRPMEGSKGFFKKKFWSDVIQATKPESQGGGGLQLVSLNPEVLIRTYLEDVRKFAYARAWFYEAKNTGALQWVSEGTRVPDGWAKIDDQIVRRFFPKGKVPLVVGGEAKTGQVATQQFTPAGQWVAREAEARLVNNLHGVDKIRADPTMRGVLAANASLNAIQLGLSAFHLQSEAFNAWATMAGHATSALARGEPLTALKNLARTPTAPLEYLVRGARLWNDPALREGVLSNIPNVGRVDLNPLRYGMRLAQPTGAFAPGTAWDAFKKLYRRRSLRVEGRPYIAAEALFAPIDLASKPIFSYIVPRMKVGAYYDILANEIARNQEGLVSGSIDIKTLARRAATAVDDRFGMVNYDAWFWNQNFKTAVQLLMRAPGWNFGYGREFGGGMWDLAHGQLSPRGQFLLGMLFTQVSAAAIYQKIYAGKDIESLTDVIAPRDGGVDQNGLETRRRFANPIKDMSQIMAARSFLDAPSIAGQLMLDKAAPAPVDLVRVLRTNKDYFGDYIRNPRDPVGTQLVQVANYLKRNVVPFSVQQYQRLKQEESSPLGAFLGTTKAPQSITESGSSLSQLRDLAAENTREMGPRTPQQRELDDRKAQAKHELAGGGLETPQLDTLIDEGIFGMTHDEIRRNIKRFAADVGRTPSERLIRRLPKRVRPLAEQFTKESTTAVEH